MKNIIRLISLESFHNFIGISYDEYDCYEVIQKYYKEVLNLELDSLYTARPNTKETEAHFEHERTRFIEVEEPQPGDIVVFKVFGLACHIGMYVNKEVFFHSRNTTDSCLEKLSIWKKRVVGYYRWPQLN